MSNKDHKDYIVFSAYRLYVLKTGLVEEFSSQNEKTVMIPKAQITSIAGTVAATMIADTSGSVWSTYTGINEILDRYDESRLAVSEPVKTTPVEPILGGEGSLNNFHVVGTVDEILSGQGDIHNAIPQRNMVGAISQFTHLAAVSEYPERKFVGRIIACWDPRKAAWDFSITKTTFTLNL